MFVQLPPPKTAQLATEVTVSRYPLDSHDPVGLRWERTLWTVS